MVGTIGPMVHGKTLAGKVAILGIYAACQSLGGALTGACVAAMGRLLVPEIVRASRVTIEAVAVLCFLFALHEAQMIALPLPQFHRQVPKRWRRYGTRAIFMYVIALGVGIGTRIVSAAVYAVLIWIFLTRGIGSGALVMAGFGITRSLPVAVLGLLQFNKAARVVAPSWHVAELVHLANAGFLVSAGVVLLGPLGLR